MERLQRRQDDSPTTTRARPAATADDDDDTPTRSARRTSSSQAATTTRHRSGNRSSASTISATSSVINGSLESTLAVSSTDVLVVGDSSNSSLPSATTATNMSHSTRYIIIACAAAGVLLLVSIIGICCYKRRKSRTVSTISRSKSGRVRLEDQDASFSTSSQAGDDSKDFSFGDEKEKMSMTPLASPLPLLAYQDSPQAKSPITPSGLDSNAPVRPLRTPETLDVLPSIPSTPLTPTGNPLYTKYAKPSASQGDMQNILDVSATSSLPPAYLPTSKQAADQERVEQVITDDEKSRAIKKDTIYGFAEVYGGSDDEDQDQARFSRAIGLARTVSKQESPVQGSRQAVIKGAGPPSGRAMSTIQVAKKQRSSPPLELADPPKRQLSKKHTNTEAAPKSIDDVLNTFAEQPNNVEDLTQAKEFPFPPTPASAYGVLPSTSASINSLTSASSYGPTPSASNNSIHAQLIPSGHTSNKSIGHAPAMTGYRHMNGPILSVYSEMGELAGSNSPVKNTFGSLGPPSTSSSPTLATHEEALNASASTVKSPFTTQQDSSPYLQQESTPRLPRIRTQTESSLQYGMSPTPSENQAGFTIGQTLMSSTLESAPTSPEVGYHPQNTPLNQPSINVIFPSPSPPPSRKSIGDGPKRGYAQEDTMAADGFVPLEQMTLQARQAAQNQFDYRNSIASILGEYETKS